jgi:hypothetical protein
VRGYLFWAFFFVVRTIKYNTLAKAKPMMDTSSKEVNIDALNKFFEDVALVDLYFLVGSCFNDSPKANYHLSKWSDAIDKIYNGTVPSNIKESLAKLRHLKDSSPG